MDDRKWRSLDTGLLALAGAALIGLFVVRTMWVGLYLPVALHAFENSDVRVPFFTRLTLTSVPFYAGATLAVLLGAAGTAARTRGRTVGRTLMVLAACASLSAAAIDVAGVWTALRVAPKPQSAGATPCPCSGPNACAGDCECFCNERGWVVEQTFVDRGGTGAKTHITIQHDASGAVTSFEVDSNSDGRPDRRCIYDHPCPQEGKRVQCQMRCETLGTGPQDAE